MTTTTGSLPSSPPSPTGWRRRGPLLYFALACAGMWLAMTPLLAAGFRRADARDQPGALENACIFAAMCAPALAALLVLRHVERTGRLREALALRWPRPWGRAVRACLVAVAVPAALTGAALALGTLVGRYPFGGMHASGLGTWAAEGLAGMIVSLPLFFGEELGWQGYLFPRLLRDGSRAALVRAYLLTGTAFALWHLPTLLMGGQYPGRPWYVSVPAMVISCLLVLPVLSWLRLRSDSVVPAVLGHAFVSTLSVGMVRHFADPDAPLDPLHMGIAGWPGWLVLGAFVAFLALTGRLRPGAIRRREVRA